MYVYTVDDHIERFTQGIWDASKKDDVQAFSKCIQGLKNLKLVATQRSEFAKVAIQGLSARPVVANIESFEVEASYLAKKAFTIADAMIEAEQRKV